MNKVVCTLVTASVLVSGSAFAQDKTKHSAQPLRDTQMDNVTAGSAIAVDNASVTTTNAGSVNLSGSALASATGVNIVNSSDSLVGSGVNVYANDLTTQASNGGAPVNQVNAVVQTQKTDAAVVVAARLDDVLEATAAARATNIAAAGASVDTTNNYSVNLSGASEQDAKGINIVNAAGGTVANGVNIAASTNVNATPTLNQINFVAQSGLTGGSAIAIDDASVSTTNSGSVNLSDNALAGASGLNIVNSANSAVADGVNLYTSRLGSQDSSNESEVNQANVFVQNEKSNATVTVAAAVAPYDLAAFAHANATNIAADSASISSSTTNSVDLAGAAEQNASAINLVNSAGGMVANGVNIAHTGNMNFTPALNQVNVVSQVR
ncbi:hypothetical protein [Granulicella sp. dw_53]|uniref:hypothetical protein n=1 Tax=Granulicella sp. dw_53 TaxID=2719792 RepID=UPI001BD58790|nr:hypothetical protein [Granulicella sp. dw_53]